MNISCYVLDDEFHAVELLSGYIEKTPGLSLAGTSLNPLQALAEITAVRPMLIFSDIDMPYLSGLDFAGLVEGAAIVFTTSYREYAADAFDKNAFDYLLKPFSYERFLTCIQKYRSLYLDSQPMVQQSPDFLLVKSGVKGKYEKLQMRNIIYVSSLSNYIEIYLTDKKIVIYLSMDELLEKLPNSEFSRIHKSHVIRHDAIDSIEYGQVKMKEGSILPIGRAFRKPFQDKLKNHFLVSKGPSGAGK